MCVSIYAHICVCVYTHTHTRYSVFALALAQFTRPLPIFTLKLIYIQDLCWEKSGLDCLNPRVP